MIEQRRRISQKHGSGTATAGGKDILSLVLLRVAGVVWPLTNQDLVLYCWVEPTLQTCGMTLGSGMERIGCNDIHPQHFLVRVVTIFLLTLNET